MVITQSWFNRNHKGMQHHEHMHRNSIISGVWYPQINEQATNLLSLGIHGNLK